MAMGPQRKSIGSPLYQPLADINVTPLVDVMLVLLIVFMVTAPMLASGMKINLPQSKAALPMKPKTPVVITIAKDGHLQVNGNDVELALLIDTVKARLATADDEVVHLRGDREATYGDIVTVMDRLAQNGIVKIAILGDNRKVPPFAPAGETPSATAPAVNSVAAPAPTGSAP